MRFRLRTPRPEHQEADPVEQEVWKKKLVSVVKQVQSAHPDADVEVWTMDEHRLGLSASAAGCLGSPRRTTDCKCKLAFPVAMALWFCPPQIRGDEKSGFCLKLISSCSIGY